MNFEWDERKNSSNIAHHGIDFADASTIFNNPMLIRIDNRKNYGEERWISLGQLAGAVVVIVYTIRKETIRIISIRRANRHERKVYQEKFGK